MHAFYRFCLGLYTPFHSEYWYLTTHIITYDSTYITCHIHISDVEDSRLIVRTQNSQ